MSTALVVERLGHVNMFVEDHAGITSRYRDIFDASVFMDFTEPEVGARNTLWLVGDTCFEAFTPTDSAGAIARWIDRYGAGWHSLEWTVNDLDDARDVLRKHGIRITDDRPGSYLFTHPRDLHGLCVELTTHHFPGDKRDEDGWAPTYWADEHPLGIQGEPVIRLGSSEPEKAAAAVAELVGSETTATENSAHNTLGFRVPLADHAVEFVASRSGGDNDLVGRFLADHGERVINVELGIASLDRARAFLASKSITFEQWGAQSLLLPGREMFGTPVVLSERGTA
ncbi:hypothetical protein C5E45_04100 [Nocardia nova]|uniref:VOC domain-containing protein n=1 Tax=Nocardia nova TaxID=37330 RepID=A0A2S6AVP4_9NOCA|nr:VOC family protein [Nocardia nova]PPJ33554.1 hypothetical protein C5E41_03020 [Nocardia nova]PPJ39347.1 hypothetical protein C5E45_04100 [Nocardia nova]